MDYHPQHDQRSLHWHRNCFPRHYVIPPAFHCRGGVVFRILRSVPLPATDGDPRLDQRLESERSFYHGTQVGP
jgi:hypothetical protein